MSIFELIHEKNYSSFFSLFNQSEKSWTKFEGNLIRITTIVFNDFSHRAGCAFFLRLKVSSFSAEKYKSTLKPKTLLYPSASLNTFEGFRKMLKKYYANFSLLLISMIDDHTIKKLIKRTIVSSADSCKLWIVFLSTVFVKISVVFLKHVPLCS